MARFHSLRSILFSTRIEADMEQCKEVEATQSAEEKWKSEHEMRKGYNRPKTPEKQPKEGLTRKVSNTLKRMRSKEVPTLNKIKEVGDNESTASSDDEDERERGSDDIGGRRSRQRGH